jgi:hypothetical protein
VISFDTEKVEAFLHSNADGTAAAPQTDEEIGMKPRFGNVGGELKGVSEEVIRGDESFGHCFSGPAVL